MIGAVGIDGVSSMSCSSRQKVEGAGVVERQWGSSDVQRWWRSADGEDLVVEEKA